MTVHASHPRGKMVVFAFDCTDSRVAKRIHAFEDQGFEVVAFTFRRQRYNRNFEPTWHNIELGMTRDRSYLRRLISLMRALWRVRRAREHWRQAQAAYVINLDLLLLALTAGVGRAGIPIAYEVADIQPVLVGSNWRSRTLRTVERWALERVSQLVVTSPRFIQAYFEPQQGYAGAWTLLENKLYPPVPRVVSRTGPASASQQWTIGYFGAIRCAESMTLLEALSRDDHVPVDALLRGFPTRLDPRTFFAQVERNPRLHYGGEYTNPADLAQMYQAVDFTWGFELLNKDANSRWLLPNRLYEGGYYGRPLLAPKGFMIGDIVDELGIGWTFAPPYEHSLRSFFRTLTRETYEEKRSHLNSLSEEHFLSSKQYTELADRLAATRSV